MKVCEKHDRAYDEAQGCTYCVGLEQEKAKEGFLVFSPEWRAKLAKGLPPGKLTERSMAEVMRRCFPIQLLPVPQVLFYLSEPEPVKRSGPPVSVEHSQRVKDFLQQADLVSQFLSDHFEEYGLDEADALNLVEILDDMAGKVETKEDSRIESEKSVPR